jgi:hypothetical protein
MFLVPCAMVASPIFLLCYGNEDGALGVLGLFQGLGYCFFIGLCIFQYASTNLEDFAAVLEAIFAANPWALFAAEPAPTSIHEVGSLASFMEVKFYMSVACLVLGFVL